MTGAVSDPVDRRAHELDTIAAVLPLERRDELAELLTDQDVETLRHLVNEGIDENTLRALTSDLAYLQAWSLAATGKSLPWPAPEALLLKFIAHHLWDPAKRANDPEHGMPAEVDQNLRGQGFLKVTGPHAPDIVRRRLATWSTLTNWRGLTGAFASPALKSAIRLAVRATPRPRKRKSAKADTGGVLAKMLAFIDHLIRSEAVKTPMAVITSKRRSVSRHSSDSSDVRVGFHGGVSSHNCQSTSPAHRIEHDGRQLFQCLSLRIPFRDDTLSPYLCA